MPPNEATPWSIQVRGNGVRRLAWICSAAAGTFESQVVKSRSRASSGA